MPKTILFLIFLSFTEVATAAQFHDSGFQAAVIRTDYNSQTEGQPSNPITFTSPCLFPGQFCGTGSVTYESTNGFSQNVEDWPLSDFWVLSINNENSYNKVCPTNPDPGVNCPPGQLLVEAQNPGPPNQSLPRASPGFGLMGFTAIKNSLPGEDFYRAHLVMNGMFANPEVGGIPYLSIGADRYRGNGSAVGYMNIAGMVGTSNLQFNARLWDFKLPSPVESQPATLAFYLMATTSWAGKKRGIFITLAHWNIDWSTAAEATTSLKWNWPVQESFYYPGAEFFFIDAEDIYPHCGISVPRLTTIGQEILYNLNIESLFRCASNLGAYEAPMPYHVLTIDSVHWAVEMTGENGWLWPSIHDMK